MLTCEVMAWVIATCKVRAKIIITCKVITRVPVVGISEIKARALVTSAAG